jgi:Na+/H+ antiporter NhaD/arsenite permease-like protein
VCFTGITFSVLNDTTAMLLMTPVSIQIALTLKFYPAAIVVPEVLTSNIGRAATLIGTPTNTLVGSFAGLSFSDLLTKWTPRVLLAQMALTLYLGAQ